MKTACASLIALLICFQLAEAQSESTAPPSESEKARLREISERVRAGEPNALLEAADLRPAVSLPYLRKAVDNFTGLYQPSSDVARAALKKVKGYAEYLSGDLAKAKSRGEGAFYDFDTLAKIGTPEAAAVAAPYLFDLELRVKVGAGDDVPNKESNCSYAVLALERMNFVDAPSIAGSSGSREKLVSWQKWAISKGYVPADWVSRIGAPEWMAKGRSASAEMLLYPSRR